MSDTKIRIPKQKRSIEKRNKIKEVALELFSDKGYYNISSNEIAKKANVSIGTFYSYFSDKDSLICELTKDYYISILDRIPNNDFLDSSNAKDIIKSYIEIIFEAHSYNSNFHKEITILALSNEKFRLLEEELNKYMYDKILSILKNNKDLLKVNNLENALFIILNSVESVVHSIMFYDSPYDKEDIIDELTNMLYSYLIK